MNDCMQARNEFDNSIAGVLSDIPLSKDLNVLASISVLCLLVWVLGGIEGVILFLRIKF